MLILWEEVLHRGEKLGFENAPPLRKCSLGNGSPVFHLVSVQSVLVYWLVQLSASHHIGGGGIYIGGGEGADCRITGPAPSKPLSPSHQRPIYTLYICTNHEIQAVSAYMHFGSSSCHYIHVLVQRLSLT